MGTKSEQQPGAQPFLGHSAFFGQHLALGQPSFLGQTQEASGHGVPGLQQSCLSQHFLGQQDFLGQHFLTQGAGASGAGAAS